MRNFETIIDSIEKQLEELRRINKELMLENTGLKNQLAEVNSSPVSFVSVDDAFRSLPNYGRDKRAKTIAYNAIKNHGYDNICDLKGVRFYEWENVGPQTAAIIAIILDHYGIKPEIPVSGACRTIDENRKNYFYF